MHLTLRISDKAAVELGTAGEHSFDEVGGTIGRAAGNDWVVPDPRRVLSSRHAVVVFEQGGFAVTDTSTNGVFFGDETEPVGRGRTRALHHGDRLTMGDLRMVVILEAAPALRPTAASFAPAAPMRAPPAAMVPMPMAPVPMAPVPMAPVPMAPVPMAPMPMAPLPAPAEPFAAEGSQALRRRQPIALGEPAPAMPSPAILPAAAAPVAAFRATLPHDFQPLAPSSPAATASAPIGGGLPVDWDDLLGDLVPPQAKAPPRGDEPPTRFTTVPAPAPPRPSFAPAFAPVAPLPDPAQTPAMAFPDPFPPMALPGAAPSAFAPVAFPSAVAPAAFPGAFAPAAFPGAVAPATFPGAAAPAAFPGAVAPAAFPGAVAPMALPDPMPPMAMAELLPPDAVPAEIVPPQPFVEAHAPRAGAAAALAEFFSAAGLEPGDESEAECLQALRDAGEALRLAADGIVDVLAGRKLFKTEIRVANTTLRAVENNAFKFSPDGQAALASLLGRRDPGYLPLGAAIAQSFDDIKAHEIAVVAAIDAAMQALLDRLNPKTLQSRLAQRQGMKGGLGAKTRYWDAFIESYEELAGNAADTFREVFGEQFGEVYAEQLERMRARGGRT